MLADLDRRATPHVGMIALVAVAIAFVGSAIHLTRFDQAPDTGPDRAVAPTSDAGRGDPMPAAAAVGPRIGDDLAPYLEERDEALAGYVDEEVVRAVVSFTSYLRADEVAVPDDIAVEAVQLRVPVVDVPPVQVAASDDDLVEVVTRAVEAERAALEEEARDLETTLASDVGDLDFEADFTQRLEELGDLDDVSPEAPVVFAVVVSAAASDLRTWSTHEEVRLVDPGGLQEATARTRFYGLLPDDTVRASHGRPL